MDMHLSETEMKVDFQKGCITSLRYGAFEWIAREIPLFQIRLMKPSGELILLHAFDAKKCQETCRSAVYSGFSQDITVRVELTQAQAWEWRIFVENNTDCAIEWIRFPDVALKPLAKNGGDASILFPYNEGAIVEDALLRQQTALCSRDPEYPSHGSYAMFPNMISSQFMCYLSQGKGLYMGAHDPCRGVKSIDFYPEENSVVLLDRVFCGTEFGGSYHSDFPIVWQPFAGDWHDGAEIYRRWLEQNLPAGMKRIPENTELPEWYEDSPLVVTYPVRGLFDTDEMKPNALFPYTNAMPVLEDIAKRTQSRLMVLLMHWEGTAPWAPPEVWPPYGGEAMLSDFGDRLHKQGHLLGVYCSGFGWTEQSRLIDSYNRAEEYVRDGLEEAMCAGPDGKVLHSSICTAQRQGYDLCVGNPRAREILNRAYAPLFTSNLDYVQILDQNHGGGQYFCYSRNHEHPPVPGSWMTKTMSGLLDDWNRQAPGKLFGCESAAAEPFIPNLLFSDNRFELNWMIGAPVPLYSYLYHEYLRNFMGNQVSCGLASSVDTLRARMAYSFVAGDCMTLILSPCGGIAQNWGRSGLTGVKADDELTITFASNMTEFYRSDAKPYLHCGRMIKPLSYSCDMLTYPTRDGRETEVKAVLSTAWERDGARVQIFVNHTAQPVQVRLENGKALTVERLNALIMDL